jgi:hypothetical protein
LGRHRWKVERSLSWLGCFRRLQIRWDRDAGRLQVVHDRPGRRLGAAEERRQQRVGLLDLVRLGGRRRHCL